MSTSLVPSNERRGTSAHAPISMSASHSPPTYRTTYLPVDGTLRPWVKALVGVRIDGAGPIALSVAPHDAFMFTVQLGRSADALEEKGEPGRNTTLTRLREWTGAFHGAGNCLTLFAMLTPAGVVQILQSRELASAPRIRARVADLLDRRVTLELESAIHAGETLEAKVGAFGRWLENHVERLRRQSPAAVRAARVAMRLADDPALSIDDLARDCSLSRRQLERDFSRWLGSSPRHIARVARLQEVSRRALAGAPLADVAADLGFADQAHMSNVVKQLTGLTPLRYVGAAQSPMGIVFRHATRGGTVYL